MFCPLGSMIVAVVISVSANAPDLTADVQRIVQSKGPSKGVTAVSIRDGDGELVVSIEGDRPLMPASNLKVLTTGAALRALGPDFAFQTRLLRQDDRLLVVGDGDPGFGDPELLKQMSLRDANGQIRSGLTPEAILDVWAVAVRDAGLTRVRELVVDDRVFDRSTCHLDWPVDQLHEDYCAEVAGVNFHLNRIDVWMKPSPRGAEVERTSPDTRCVSFVNRSALGKDRKGSVWLHREPDDNVFTLRGFLRAQQSASTSVSVSDPPSLFGNLLAERLRLQGVQVDAVRLAGPADPPAAGEPVGPAIRTPLATVVRRANTDSQNLHAEALLKRIGHQVSGTSGSWENGGQAVETLIAGRVGGAAGLTMADGSGLSRNNRVNADLMTGWIHDLVHDPRVAEIFTESLAVGGRTGTLRKRFRDIPADRAVVRAKSGYIDGVSGLCGVVELPNGHVIPFSVMSNGFTDGPSKAREVQEAVVRLIIDRFGHLPPRSATAPRTVLGGE
jgi:D-alanyl-D-alanine carboxypeptidase/D-alanyl-D-alanine-endopeptidase (penicillin-binding protein 4)